MFMSTTEWHHVLQFVRFSPSQQTAMEAVWQKTMQSDVLMRMACHDAANLADLNGPEKIEADDITLAAILGEHAGMYPVLILLSRVDWLKEQYDHLGLSEQMLRMVLSDIPLWLENSQRRTGQMVMREYEWLTNHMRMRLFRLGRLQFIYKDCNRVPAVFYRHRHTGQVFALAEAGMCFDAAGELCAQGKGVEATFVQDNQTVMGNKFDHNTGRACIQPVTLRKEEWQQVLCPDDPVLDIHIPEGPPLQPHEISESFAMAPLFYRDRLGISDIHAFTCGSWLMNPALSYMMPNSRLAAFQKMFRIIPYTLRDNQVFERVYGHAFTSWDELPQTTRLQRSVREWYQQGGHCRQMQGVILLDIPS